MPGAALAVAVDGKLVASTAYGVLDVQSKAPVTRATLFRLGSISKFVTAAAVMRLVQTRQIRLSDQVSSILGNRLDLSPSLRGVTVKQLLNHTSGLSDITSREIGELIARDAPISDDAVAAALRRPMVSPRGQTWAYNNVGYRLLSWVVEDVTHRRFNDYVVGELAPALELPSLQPCDLARSQKALGYISSEGNLIPDPSYAVRGLLGEGGLCANAGDLALLPSRLLAGKFINADTIAAMTRPTILPDGALADYGLGVRRGIIGTEPFWGHSGSGMAGGWAAVAHYHRRRMTIAVLGNGSGGSTDAIGLQAKIAAILLDQQGLRNDEVEPWVRQALPLAFEADGSRICFDRVPNGLTRRVAGSTAPPRALLNQGGGVFARTDYPLDRYVIQLSGNRPLAHRAYYDGFFAEFLRPAQPKSC